MQSNISFSTILFTLLAFSSPFFTAVNAAKPTTLLTSSVVATAAAATTDLSLSSQTDTTGTKEASGTADSSWAASSSVDSSASTSTTAAKSQWIQINTPMGKITTCSTIMLSWSSGGVSGPLEIDLVSCTTGDIITIDSDIDLSKGATSYKWTVAAPADTYYLQGNAADFPTLLYSGNFTVSKGSSTACVDKQVSSSAIASASGSGTAAKQSATAAATPSTGATFVSGAERVMISGFTIISLAILVTLCF